MSARQHVGKGVRSRLVRMGKIQCVASQPDRDRQCSMESAQMFQPKIASMLQSQMTLS